jgi:hypothetical protein
MSKSAHNSSSSDTSSKHSSDILVYTTSHSNIIHDTQLQQQQQHRQEHRKRHPPQPMSSLWQHKHFSQSYHTAIENIEATSDYYDTMGEFVDVSTPNLKAERQKRIIKILTLSRMSKHQKLKCTVISSVTGFTFLSILMLFIYLYGACECFLICHVFYSKNSHNELFQIKKKRRVLSWQTHQKIKVFTSSYI